MLESLKKDVVQIAKRAQKDGLCKTFCPETSVPGIKKQANVSHYTDSGGQRAFNGKRYGCLRLGCQCR